MNILALLVLMASNPYSGDPDAVRAGAKLYHRHCAPCHGSDANGIRKAPPIRGRPADEVRPILKNGVIGRGMPSWSKLPEQQRWQIATFLEQLR